MPDPLSAAIEAAVVRALEAKLSDIVRSIVQELAPHGQQPDRFIPMAEAATMLGLAPSSVWRLERDGKLPPRERVAGKVGYRLSTVERILDGVSTTPNPAPKSAIRKGGSRQR